MKLFLLIALLCAPLMCLAQNNQLQKTGAETLSKHSENKDIGLSHNTSDIITFSQLAEVSEITIENIPDCNIISYDLTYFIRERNSLKIFTGKGEKIPDSLIQEIIASGSNQILIENLIISRKGELETAGFRNFYVN